MKPLVSVIVTTRNNETTIEACLKSIVSQSYKSIELIVVDNRSADKTTSIARQYTKKVYIKGPERSTQRNYAVSKSTGQFILIIDSDMELSEKVVEECARRAQGDPKVGALIIPEESFGVGFWAQCKRLERSFYVGQDAIEAARFFDAEVYKKIGGYNENMVGGEDWDLSRRVSRVVPIDRIHSFIYHNEGHLRFTSTLKKMYYYGQHAATYFKSNPNESAITSSSGPLARYKLYFSQPTKLFRKPLYGVGMLVLKTAEYCSGGFGYKRAIAKSK